MKIVLFDYFIHFGGAPQLAADMCYRMVAEHDVEVINVYGVCQEYIEELTNNGIPAHILLPEIENVIIGHRHDRIRRLSALISRIPVLMRLRKRLAKKVQEIAPDVIWTTTDHSLLFLKLCPSLKRYPAVKYDCGCRMAEAIGRWQRWVNKTRATLIMTSSTETARQLERAGVDAEKITVVFETVNITKLQEQSKAALKESLPGQEKKPRILVPATLLRTKGQHTAIKAIARLKAEGIDPALWLAGDVVGSDNSYLEYLKELVQDLDISDNVYFLGWRYDIPAVMTRSDIVVLPTHTEGFGRVALEAMLLRRPAVTTPAGGMKDSIQDGHDGLFFPVDDDESLAQHLVRLSSDSQFAARLIKNGYQTVTEKFHPQVHHKRVLAVLTRAAGYRSKPKNN